MVSVIIVVYNGEEYIEEAIKSVINQSYRDIEIVVADDGSTDNTREIVKKYKDVIYVYQENMGEGSARNLGIDASKGEYLAFLDADDIYRKDKIEKQLEVLIKNKDIDVVYNDLEVVNANLEHMNILKSEGIYKKKQDLLAQILYRQVIQGPICMMIRRKCIEGIKWSENLIYTVDYEYIIKLAMKYNFKYIEEPLYIYRRHSCNLSNKHDKTLVEEKGIIKKIGMNRIEKIISETSFEEVEKNILLSKIYMKIEEYEKALKILKFINENEYKSIINFNMGVCNYKLENMEKAKENNIVAIENDKNMSEAYNNLACCMYRDNVIRAKDYLNRALNIRPNYMDARDNLNNLNKGLDYLKITEKELRKTLTVYN